MFSGLNKDEMRVVTDAMSVVYSEKQEYVIKEGEDGDDMFVMERGKMRAEKYLNQD